MTGGSRQGVGVASAERATPQRLRTTTANFLRATAPEAGANDVGFVSIDRPELAKESPRVQAPFSRASLGNVTASTFAAQLEEARKIA